jgi:hypothetical protein
MPFIGLPGGGPGGPDIFGSIGLSLNDVVKERSFWH